MKFSRRSILQYGALGALTAVSSVKSMADAAAKKASTESKGLAPRATSSESASELVSLAVLALSRATYGVTPDSLASFVTNGKTPRSQLEHFVDSQLQPEKIDDKICDGRLHALGLTTLDKPLAKLWADHAVMPNQIREEIKEGKTEMGKFDENKLRQAPALETEIATWTRAVYSQRQLKEVLVEFWHDHFNVFAYEGNPASVFTHYDRDVIRTHALGNFRAFLEAVAASPAMLFYLDNFVNQSANPNENYARELFELHTLGAENYLGTEDRSQVAGFKKHEPVGYVDGDVYEAARCFTGWKVDTGKNTTETGAFAYVDQHHDRFQKIVLGNAIPEMQKPLADGRRVLDLLSQHPGTAHFIATKLCRRFISDQPPQRIVDASAKLFAEKRNAPDQIAQVVKLILLSPEFAGSFGEKIKRPFDSVVGLLRATGADFTPTEKFINSFNRCGQRRFAWRSPDGYPDKKEKWGTTTAWLEKWRFSNQLMFGKIDGVKVDLTTELQKIGHSTPTAIAEYWSTRLLARPMDAKAMAEVVDILAQGRKTNRGLASEQVSNRVAPAVALVAMSPQFQWR